MRNPLIDIIKEAKIWLTATDYPLNETVRRLRTSTFIEHNGVKLKNMHRSETELCDLLAGLVVTQRVRQQSAKEVLIKAELNLFNSDSKA